MLFGVAAAAVVFSVLNFVIVSASNFPSVLSFCFIFLFFSFFRSLSPCASVCVWRCFHQHWVLNPSSNWLMLYCELGAYKLSTYFEAWLRPLPKKMCTLYTQIQSIIKYLCQFISSIFLRQQWNALFFRLAHTLAWPVLFIVRNTSSWHTQNAKLTFSRSRLNDNGRIHRTQK